MLDQNINMLDQNFENELLKILNSIEKVDDSVELIEDIFNLHFEVSKNDLIQQLSLHLNEVFNINSTYLIRYIQSEGFITFSSLDNSKLNILNTLNKLKRKYGYVLRGIQSKNDNPFFLKGMGLSFQEKESLFNASFHRQDGCYFDVMVNAQSLLNIVNLSTIHIRNVLSSGVYNLDINAVNNYLENSQKLLDTFMDMLKQPNA